MNHHVPWYITHAVELFDKKIDHDLVHSKTKYCNYFVTICYVVSERHEYFFPTTLSLYTNYCKHIVPLEYI